MSDDAKDATWATWNWDATQNVVCGAIIVRSDLVLDLLRRVLAGHARGRV
jgi:hypothetical protein